MRRLVPILAGLVLLACDAGVSGTYELVSIDGEELPVAWEFFDIVSITAGSLTLSDSTYEYTLTTADRAGNLSSVTEWGTFTRDDANTICFSSATSSAPPPPPPPPGGTVSSTTPAVESRAPQREAAGSFDCIGTWDGDQITAAEDDDTWVFRRQAPQ